MAAGTGGASAGSGYVLGGRNPAAKVFGILFPGRHFARQTPEPSPAVEQRVRREYTQEYVCDLQFPRSAISYV